MDGLVQDVRYALRTLRKSPAFVTITVLTLALGIGANLAIFAVVNAVLLQPLPFREPDRLVRVFDDLGGAGAKNAGMSVPELQDLQRSGIFEQITALYPSSSALSGGDNVERIELLGTSPNYFEVLGATPALGRTYTQSEWVPGFLDAVVISNGLWERQFGSDPHVIGRSVRVDEDAYTVVGVMPPEFRRPGLILTATGTIVGLGASIVVTRLMSSLLFGVSASDPMTFAVVPVLLGIVTMAACFIPARRATRVSPMEALK